MHILYPIRGMDTATPQMTSCVQCHPQRYFAERYHVSWLACLKSLLFSHHIHPCYLGRLSTCGIPIVAKTKFSEAAGPEYHKRWNLRRIEGALTTTIRRRARKRNSGGAPTGAAASMILVLGPIIYFAAATVRSGDTTEAARASRIVKLSL